MNDVNLLLVRISYPIVLVALLYGLAEMLGRWRFWPWAYWFGVPVWLERRLVPMPDRPGGVAFETASGEFKIIRPGVCLFRRKFCRGWWETQTPFPIQGTIRWDGDQATIAGRIPLGPLAFFVVWLINWGSGAFNVLTSTDASTGSPILGALAMLFMGLAALGLAVFSASFELRRIKRVLEELCRIEAIVGEPRKD